jgi:hypothetical protein
MDSFLARIFGRQEDEVPEYRALTALNICSGPGTQHAALPGSPLPLGTCMHVLRAQDSWRLVDVLDVVNSTPDLVGWVHNRFIVRTSQDSPKEGIVETVIL